MPRRMRYLQDCREYHILLITPKVHDILSLYDKLTFKRDELQKKYQSADEIIVNQKNNTAIMPAEMSWYDRRFS